MPAHGELK